jgi:hypothetical protein
MKRSMTKVVIQDNKTRYRVTIESDECLKGSQEARVIQFLLLRSIADEPSLTACGMSDFQRMTMTHNGEKWIVECESIEENK